MKNPLTELNLQFPTDYLQLTTIGFAVYGALQLPGFFQYVLATLFILFGVLFIKGSYGKTQQELMERAKQYQEARRE